MTKKGQSFYANLLGGSPGACCPKNVNVDPLKLMKTFILLLICASSASSRRATKLHEKEHFARDVEKLGAVVISKSFTKGALGATTPTFWVWPSCNHAHIFKAQI